MSSGQTARRATPRFCKTEMTKMRTIKMRRRADTKEERKRTTHETLAARDVLEQKSRDREVVRLKLPTLRRPVLGLAEVRMGMVHTEEKGDLVLVGDDPEDLLEDLDGSELLAGTKLGEVEERSLGTLTTESLKADIRSLLGDGAVGDVGLPEVVLCERDLRQERNVGLGLDELGENLHRERGLIEDARLVVILVPVERVDVTVGCACGRRISACGIEYREQARHAPLGIYIVMYPVCMACASDCMTRWLLPEPEPVSRKQAQYGGSELKGQQGPT